MAISQQFLPPVNNYTGSYTEDTEGDGVRLNAFNHEDTDIAFDPLSANRRFAGTADLAVLGTLVFAGPTRESISVMVPDCLLPPGEQYSSSGSAPSCWVVAGTGRRHDQLVSRRSSGEGFVSGVPGRHTGTPATRILGGAQPDPQAMEKRE